MNEEEEKLIQKKAAEREKRYLRDFERRLKGDRKKKGNIKKNTYY